MDHPITVGVLALQGAFAKHCEMLEKLNISFLEIRRPSELSYCDGLIIPGGESTTISYLMKKHGLNEALLAFNKPIYGTCAGLILLAKHIENAPIPSLALLDVKVRRNAYGRQIHSFSRSLTLNWQGHIKSFEAAFIRAPLITEIFSPCVEVLAYLDQQPVFVRQGKIFASSFHPELTQDLSIHQLFAECIVDSI